MSKVNPLYILLLLLFVALYSFFALNKANTELFTAQNEYVGAKSSAVEFDRLSQKYSKEYTIKQINELKKIDKVSLKQTATKYILTVQNDILAAQKLLNKVLNSYLQIERLNITKNHLEIEIKKI